LKYVIQNNVFLGKTAAKTVACSGSQEGDTRMLMPIIHAP